MPLTTINGCQHYYEDIGAGEVVVLLHGNQNSSRYFDRLIPDLATDFRVIAPDLRGMGRSEHVAKLPPTAWVDDTLALLNALGIEQAHVYGVSLGGLVAIRIAVSSPERVHTLTIDAPIIAIDPTPPAARSQPPAASIPPPRVADELRAMHGDDWQTVTENCNRFYQSAELRAFLNPSDIVAAITAPTLIIRGDIEEDVHPLMHAVELHALLPHSWLWISPHSRSLLTRRHPADSAGVFRNFVTEATGAPGSEEPAFRDHLELLAGIDLFAGLDRGSLSRLAALANAATFRAGDLVFHQGDVADGLYVVADGRFSVTLSPADSGGEVQVRQMGRGETFGEMALLTNEPRSATVRCETEGMLLHLAQTPILSLLRRDAAVATAVATTLSRRIRAQDQVLLAKIRSDHFTSDTSPG